MTAPTEVVTQAKRRLAGTEQFHLAGNPMGFDVKSFWQWAHSDLLGNALRGVVAEYLVARACGEVEGVREEWDAHDLVLDGRIRVEVKSSAYVQSWAQRRRSTITFGIAPTLGWSASTNASATDKKRNSDVYVFALLAHQERQTIEPLDVGQWRFFVLPARVLDERCAGQRSIGLAPLLRLGAAECTFAELASRLRDAVSG
ncbi:MAG: hypothetical protein JWM82_939 [Myxococcales bacterium]|nr:hypothetical protein [Myxococcales bacterium]